MSIQRCTTRPATFIIALMLSTLCAPCLSAAVQESGYLGANIVDNAAGQTVFSWFFPGPLDGRSLRAAAFDLQRPDVLISIDGEPMDAAKANEYIRTRSPGTEITIAYQPARQRGTANIPGEVETTGETKTITVTIANRDEYTGTIGRPRALARDWTPPDTEPLLAPFDPSNILGEAVAEHGLVEPLETLTGVFRQFIERTTDTHMLSRVRAGFRHPFALPELEREMTADARTLADDPLASVRRMMRDSLDLDEPNGVDRIMTGNAGLPGYQHANTLWAELATAHARIERALGPLAGDADFARQAIEFLRVPKRTFYIAGPNAKEHIGVIRASITVDFDDLVLGVFDSLAVLAALPTDELMPGEGMEPIDPPAALADAIEGKILGAIQLIGNDDNDGWIVIGGHGPNRYDMSKIMCVIDPGGNDTYYMSEITTGLRVIIDLAGDDTYLGHPDQGIGGALLGAWLIDDRAGNDRYEGALLGPGAACFGMSLLIDRGGNDVHVGGEWTQGAASYGAGVLLSLGNGSDVYDAEFLSQGVGGPRGFGLLYDQGGNDLYRANGPHGSAYGTPAVYQSFSQGVGFGYRNYAAGGVGMLCDMAGNDRYEAGEFSQGGAYYYAIGVLYDRQGNDLYYGNRYGQGFGVHQAMGILADDAGDDTYWSMTAASQGAAWDIGVGLLIDRAGNDTYRCDGLGQGAASMQGIGMLIDLGGTDHYSAGGGATQGQSGGDSYHFASTGAYSFSLLMDLGGRQDFYSRGRANNAVTKTGEINENAPENSSAWGLIIDR